MLKDFSIAEPPNKKTKLGAKFYSTWDPQFKYLEGIDASAAAVSMRHASAIYVDAARTLLPIVMLRKYAHYYDSMKKEFMEGAMLDSWSYVSQWLDKEDWSVNAGLNFMQFADCLSKIGLLAYSGSKFDEVLPTAQDKIEHFFAAHMRLTDSVNLKSKVERRLQFARERISAVANRNKKS